MRSLSTATREIPHGAVKTQHSRKKDLNPPPKNKNPKVYNKTAILFEQMDESLEVQVKHATCLQGTKEILKLLVILFTKMENGGVGNSLVVPVVRTPS